MKPTARRMHCLAALFLASCASTQKRPSPTEAVESYVYARPLDDVLEETTRLLVLGGWQVERSRDQLGTNWRLDASGAALGYRVEGERIDADHCTIRIERLAASSFAPSVQDASPSSSRMGQHLGPPPTPGSSGGGKSASWEGLDAPSTLGDAPPGMVTLPRGRDAALEWALLRRLDPRAAESIQSADARGHLAPPKEGAAGTAPPASPATASTSACGPVLTGVDGLLSERHLVLLADVPGTKEIPDFVGRLVCQAVHKGVPTVVALELMRVDQEWVDTYLSSGGRPQDRAAFLHVTTSFDPQGTTGRGSEAVFELLERLRTLRDEGFTLRVLAFDEGLNTRERERSRAANIERVRRIEPDALMVVVLESSQAPTVLRDAEIQEGGLLGWYLWRWGLTPVPLALRSPGGETWACVSPGRSACGPVPVRATPPRTAGTSRSVELYPSPDARGFQGDYSVGPLTASGVANP